MNDQCSGIDNIPPANIFSKTADLAEKLGANQECKKEIETLAAHYSASLEAKGSIGIASAETAAQASGGMDYMKGMQSGCTPLVIAAQKIVSNSKKLQCILQKNSTDSTVNMSQVNSIQFKPLPFTPQEIANNEKEIAQFLTENPRNKYITDMQELQNNLISKLIESGKSIASIKQLTAMEFGESWDKSLQVLKNAQKRNIILNNVKITQSITGKLKILQQLSTQAQTEISDLLKQTAAATTEAGLALKVGAGALEPSGKSVSESAIEQNQNLSNTSVNAKITNVSQTLSNTNILEMAGPGEVSLQNITIDQNIFLNVITEMLISDAISAGVKAQSDLGVDSKTTSSLQAEVKGVDDMIKEQGDANQKAIQANKLGYFNSLISLAFFFLFMKYQDKLDPVVKYTFIGIALLFFVIAVIIFFLFFESFISSIASFFNIPKPAFESTLNRPLIIYQNLLKSMKCDKVLTIKDKEVLIWDALDDIQARIEIEKYAKSYCSLK